MTDTLKGLLGDNADEKIKNIIDILNPPQSEGNPAAGKASETDGAATAAVSPDLLLQAQKLMSGLSSSGGDDRAALLKSLKPFMRQERRDAIDSALRLMELAKLTELFDGGIKGDRNV